MFVQVENQPEEAARTIFMKCSNFTLKEMNVYLLVNTCKGNSKT